jgi:hypothetical protein
MTKTIGSPELAFYHSRYGRILLAPAISDGESARKPGIVVPVLS